MTEAIFGLIGVVVGGLLTAGMTWLMARRAEQASLRTGARLARSEIYESMRVIQEWLGLNHVFPEWWEEPTTWHEQRGVLAARLPADAWKLVDGAFARLRYVTVSMNDLAKADPDQAWNKAEMSDESQRRWETHLAALTAAAGVLATAEGTDTSDMPTGGYFR
ncbi:MAG TPA: hypothetical protein VEW95_11075 [Candidatus Limnocylindrales bacterium]|nr:hypothetical protein [Candidatus Limnocylindrales bacterium]